jgi:PleD family two-component response regulator
MLSSTRFIGRLKGLRSGVNLYDNSPSISYSRFGTAMRLGASSDKLIEAKHHSSNTCESSLHHDGLLRTLVVDDAATNRKLLARLLERRGHSCEKAKDGQRRSRK